MNLFREIRRRINPFMKSRGFSISGRNYYYFANNIAFCIAFDMPTGLMYVTSYIMPLYIPFECRYYTYGNRLNAIGDIKLPLLHKDSDEATIDEWCKFLCCKIDQYIIPFFREIETTDKLLKFSDNYHYSADSYVACNDLDILHLRMFTFLYVGDYVNVADVTTSYREVLGSASFLTDLGIQILNEEIDMIVSLAQDKDRAKEFFSQVENNMRKIIQ
ncbi:MAG: hypothetical protein ACI4TK_13230 [Agathobacter sp.]